MILLAATLWFAQPAPLEMPRASAYLVKDAEGALWLEDRYDEADLWTARTVLSRWSDREGRRFTVAKLETIAPTVEGPTLTRERFVADEMPLPDKREDLREQAIALLAPFDLPDEPSAPRRDVHGFKEVRYYQGTNETAVVCAFRPEDTKACYLAVWELAPGDSIDSAVDVFETDFLAKWKDRLREGVRSELDPPPAPPRRARRRPHLAERELMLAAARHSVTNYPNWHVTAAREFVVLDDLPRDNPFVTTLTNELTAMRTKYAAAIPSPVSGSNVLAVARIFKDRDEYALSLDDNDIDGMEWSAAYWSPRRRELVAYLPMGGGRELLKTFRHEAFHQYLSYACSMIETSPWLNEGYAEYFEDENASDWGMEVDLEQLAELLPALLGMDYVQFYSGSAAERTLKYRMAWSIAYFLEKGAPKVRFEPFKDVKKTYVESLLRHQDPRRATSEAFGSEENLKKFVSEWKKFWATL